MALLPPWPPMLRAIARILKQNTPFILERLGRDKALPTSKKLMQAYYGDGF